ncbi:MAG: adenylate/guanylate cyclase domain-containing protein [Proteobacteria bacterium]|nr:adenylate/guanylate cyclase domain-containing protein [Pseudomonadota bacterium]
MKGIGAKLGKAAAALVALPMGLLLAMLALAEPQPVRSMRDIIFDSFQRWSPRAFDPQMPARIVDIDDESLEKIGQWPWPRTVMAQLVDRIGASEPLVIALDIVFSEPDRTSPERILKLLPPSPEREALEGKLATENYTNDRVLSESFARWPVVSGIVMADKAQAPPVLAGFASAGDAPEPFLPKFRGAVAPIPILLPGLKGFGALNWVPEYDQVVRRVPTVLVGEGRMAPSLAIEALRVAQGASTIILKASNASGETAFGQQTGIVSLKVGELVVPTDADGAVRLRYAGTRPERRIPAWKVLTGAVPKEEIEGRIVFVGSSAAALSDLRASPLDPVIPGVEVHAEMVEHILAGQKLSRPDWAPGAEAIGTVLATLLATLLTYRFVPQLAAFCTILMIGGIAYGSWSLFRNADMLLDPIMPAFAGGVAFATTSVMRWKASDSERRAVRTAFTRYLSPAMVERLADAPDQLKLGGERRNLTLMFSDVRGFTSLSESFRHDPQGLTTLMNRLLTPLSNAIIERSGTIDKYMGDAIMAFWNAPLDVEDHAGEACRTALEMRQRLDALNAALAGEAEMAGRKHTPIDIGIGLNSGDCIVGNMGSDIRFDYSVLGDPVNLASRLEGQTKAYGVNIIAGEATEALARGRFALVEIDRIRVKGKREPQRIFALLGDHVTLAQPHMDALAAGTTLLLDNIRRQDWDEAEHDIRALHRVAWAFNFTPYLDIMAARIAEYRTHPPGTDWDGVYVATSK